MFVDSHVCHVIVCNVCHVIVCNPREPRPLCVCVCFVCVCVCVRARSCVLCAALGLRTVNESGKMRAIVGP